MSQGQRRLGAIMFTDVVGYSSIASRDEGKALKLLDEHKAVLQSVFPRHEGRIVKTMGDAFLVEFASAVEAVNCAVEVQEEMKRFNSGRDPADRIMVRVGIHVGDIVHSDGDVLGDAVNVAARVEPIAEPGGIAVTRQVVDQVERKVGHKIVKVGLRELKNIPGPVEIYKVLAQSDIPRSWEGQALDRRRVAILPLVNMSANPDDRYFADGLTEELISTVSRIGELSVISRTSVMRYRDTSLPMSQIGAELGAGTILEGSVRKAGNKIRVTAQLIESSSDKHLWAQSYDRDLTDVFAIQGDIAQQVADSLKVRLLSSDKANLQKKATDNPEAYELYLRGRVHWGERTKEGIERALSYFAAAVKEDPNFAVAYSGIADCYSILSDRRWMEPAKALPPAKSNALKAIELDEGLAEAHASMGLVLDNFDWDFGGAEREYKRAIELNPNYATAYHWYALNLSVMKRYDEALFMVRRAYELDPYSRAISNGVGVALMEMGRYEEAITQLEKVQALDPSYAAGHFFLSMAYDCIKRYDKAIEEAERAVRLEPSLKVNLARIYADAGKKEMAERILGEIDAGPLTVPGTLVAGVLLSLGRADEGFALLEKAYADRDPFLLYFLKFTWNGPYLSDPRWLEIERKLNIAKR